MKKKGLIILSIILIGIFTGFLNLKIVGASPSQRSFVDPDTSIGGNVQNQLIYFSSPVNLWYYFYHETTNIQWRTSNNGITWSSEWSYNVGFTIAGGGFDVCKGPNGDIHFVMVELDVAGDEIYYLNASPHIDSSGNITFGATQNAITIPASDIAGNFRIETDSDNYAWIGYSQFNGVNAYPYLLVNSMNDGTWNTNFTGMVEINAGTAWTVIPLRLNDRKMMIVHAESGSRKIRFRLWLGDGTGWNNTAKNLSKYNIATYGHLDADSLGDKCYVTYVNETDFNLRYIEWSGALTPSAGWNDELTKTVVDSNSYPNIVKIRQRNLILIEWHQKRSVGGGRCLYYQTRNNGIWLANPALWYNETGNSVSVNAKGINKRARQSYARDFIGLAYLRTSGSPTGAWFASLGAIELGWPSTVPRPVPNKTAIYDGNNNSINGEWIFENEMYVLQTVVNNTAYCKFNISDGVNELIFEYWNSTNFMSVEGDNELVVSGVGSYYEVVGSKVKLKWTFHLNKKVRDIVNTTINAYCEDINGSGVFWPQIDGILFHIYNLGGLTAYEFIGDGQQTPYAQAFDLQATNGSLGSSAYAEQIYRRLQHVHFLAELNFSQDWNAVNNEFDIEVGHGWFEFGIDYRINGAWVDGWRLRTYIQDGDVGHHLLGVDHSWMEMVVDWYNRGFNNKTTYLYTYNWGYDTEHSPRGWADRRSSMFWIDFWLPRESESKLVGGHFNSYWHGMYEQGSAFWFGYGKFRPKIGNYTESLFIDDLYNGSSGTPFKKKNEGIESCMDIELYKVWVKVEKGNFAASNDDTYSIKLHEYTKRQAEDVMEGIDRPEWIETTDPSMPNVGSQNPITKFLGMIGGLILNGIINGLKYITGSMANFAAKYLGIPTSFWSRIYNFIASIPSLIYSVLRNIPTLITAFISIFDDIANFITITVPRWVLFLGMVVSSFFIWFREIVNLFTGGWGGMRNIWVLWGMDQWIELIVLIILPLYIVIDITSNKRPLDRAWWYMNMISGFFTGLLNFFKFVVDIIIDFVSMIAEMLPF